jgi:transposase
MASAVCSIWMMARPQLDNRQWAKLEPLLASGGRGGRPPKDNRNFIEAVLWWRRTGVPWRDLPETFGPWKTVFNRFDRWSKAGKWSRLFGRFKPIATMNGTASTARSTGLTNTPREEKGGC